MVFSPVPKNVGRLDADARLAAKVQRVLDRKRQRKGLTRKSRLVAKNPMAKVNPTRQAKRRAKYAKVIRSTFHKRLRFQAWLRSGGLCECEQCVNVRLTRTVWETDELIALKKIPVWFVPGGGPSWKRFRSDDGEIHHTSYALYGKENPDELRLVRWVWVGCHQRIEAEQGTRRRYLSGKVA